MGEYLGTLGQNSAAIIILAVIIVGVASYFVLKKLSHRVIKQEKNLNKNTEPETEAIVPPIVGKFKAMVIEMEPEPALNFTYIDKPLGCINLADPSLPMNGPIYVVKKLNTGQLVDYDINDEEYVAEESPEYAYFATDWSIARVVFSVPLPFWKTPALWIAVIIWVFIFIWGLVLIGG